MNIGLLGGSFSPPHIGHLWTAQQVLEDKDWKLDKIWMVPTSGLNHYGKVLEVSAGVRLHLCQLAVKDFGNPNIEVSDIEIMKGIEYTYQLAEYLSTTQPNNKFRFIVGGDWDITEFKNWEKINELSEGFIDVHRPGYMDVETSLDGDSYGVCGEGYQDIEFSLSSSIIRERVAAGMTIRGLATPSVEKYIKEYNLYV